MHIGTHSRTLAFMLLLGSFAMAGAAQNAETEVRTYLEQRDRDIKLAIARMDGDPVQEERVRALVNDGIDFREMGRLALGEFDQGLTEAQRTKYVETFGAIVRAQSLSDLTIYNAKVTFDKVVVAGGKAHVYSRAEVDGKLLDVEYLLHAKGDTWWLYDIVLDGVGTVEGYAVSFQSVIRKRGFDRLMASLQKKRARLETATGS